VSETAAATRDLLYLPRRDVAALLPAPIEQIDLAEQTYLAMGAGEVEMPPKPGIHPRKDAFIHAMPAYLAGQDVAAMKWVSGYPDNHAQGLPYISGLMIVNDAATGVPLAVMDAVEITAARTAAASGVCIRRWAPAGWRRAAILGCGEQGRYHAAVLQALNPDVTIAAWDPIPERVAAMPGRVEQAADAREAVTGAEIVITAGPIVEDPDPVVIRDWVAEGALVLPIDFDAIVAVDIVREAGLFVVDDVGQFEYYRGRGHFRDWPRPSASLGRALADDLRAKGVVCCNLGVGALDAAFADRVVRSAGALAAPMHLPL
jgi:ornithine cyclodeaminase/alanine dehydrogenase